MRSDVYRIMAKSLKQLRERLVKMSALAAGVGAAVALSLGVAWADAAAVEWRESGAKSRLALQLREAAPVAVVEWPRTLLDSKSGAQFSAYYDGEARGVRVADTSDEGYTLLVDTRGVAAGSEMTLYAGAGTMKDTAVVDPLPVAVAIHQAGAFEAPPSWEEMRFMATEPPEGAVEFRLDTIRGFTNEDEDVTKWYRASWKRPSYVAKLSGRLIVAEAGEYSLGVRSGQPCYLTLNGSLVAADTSLRRASEEWSGGAPLRLEKGLHDFTVLVVCEKTVSVEMGWRKPGGGAYERIGSESLFPDRRPLAYRVEHRDAEINTGISYELGAPYGFWGSEVVFTPLTLEALTKGAAPSAGDVLETRWSAAGALLGMGATVKLVATNRAALPVELVVAAKDGGRAQAELEIKLPGEFRRQYRVAAELVGVPAVAFEDDPAEPEVHLRGNSPESLPLTITAWVTDRRGVEESFFKVVRLKRGWTRYKLPSYHMRDLERIRWSVLHAGVEVERGELQIGREPFTVLPTATDGSYLEIEDALAALVVPRASRSGAEAVSGLESGAKVMILDGFLEENAAVVNGAGEGLAARLERALAPSADSPGEASASIEVRRVASGAVSDGAQRRTLGEMDLLAGLAELDPADLAVVAPDFRLLTRNSELSTFERNLTALVSLLERGVAARVVLLTPLPGQLVFEIDGEARDLTPEYAEVVMRVADVMGLRVADLYTQWHTRGQGSPLEGGRLTSAAMEMVVEVLSRELAGGGGGGW